MKSSSKTYGDGLAMSEKKNKREKKKDLYEPAYTAFLPIGIVYLTLGMTLENMWAFLPVGIVFFVIGISYGIPWQRTKNKFKQQENNDTDNTPDSDVSPQNEN